VTTPYTYLIGWSEHDLWYYGVRYAKDCDPSDLWTKYFTSSKRVKSIRAELGEPNVVTIRRTCIDADSARLWEHTVLRRIKATQSNKWLNQTDNVAICLNEETIARIASKNTGQNRKPHSEETKQKIREARIGKEPWNKGKKNSKKVQRKPHSEETRQKIREAKLGIPQSQESNAKRSETLTDRILSPETKEKLRLAAISREAKRKSQRELNCERT